MESILPITLWHWFIGAVVFGVLELLLPGVVFLWMGLSAGLIGILLAVWPDMASEYQFIGFAILSIVSVVFARKIIVKRAKVSDHPVLNERSRQFIGKTFILGEASVNKVGKIKVGDSLWVVELERDLNAGDEVMIESANGLQLYGKSVKDLPE